MRLIYLLFGLSLLGTASYADYRGLSLLRPTEIRNVPKSIRESEAWQVLLAANPMYGIVSAFRACVTGEAAALHFRDCQKRRTGERIGLVQFGSDPVRHAKTAAAAACLRQTLGKRYREQCGRIRRAAVRVRLSVRRLTRPSHRSLPCGPGALAPRGSGRRRRA